MNDPLSDILDSNRSDENYLAFTIINESRQRCKKIDERIKQLTTEFMKLAAEFQWLQSKGPSAQLSRVVEQLDINRDLRITLYKLRWKNT